MISTALCTMESEPSHAAVPAAEGQSLEKETVCLSTWESRLLGCIAQGRLHWVLFLIVPKFSTLYLLILVFPSDWPY